MIETRWLKLVATYYCHPLLSSRANFKHNAHSTSPLYHQILNMSSLETLVHQLSPVDHLSPRIHVPKLLYFASEASPDEIVKTFCEGLTKSIAALPTLGGTIGLSQGDRQRGTLAIQAPFQTAEDISSVRDVRNEKEPAASPIILNLVCDQKRIP